MIAFVARGQFDKTMDENAQFHKTVGERAVRLQHYLNTVGKAAKLFLANETRIWGLGGRVEEMARNLAVRPWFGCQIFL